MTHAPTSRFLAARVRLSQFCSDRRASIAPIFALAIIPVVGLVGTAVDYNRASAARASMQAALDSTALMLSREPVTLTDAERQAKATAFFNANISNSDLKNLTVTPVFTTPQSGSFQMTLTAHASVDMRFMNVLGQSQLPLASTAEVKWGIKRLELALVLDNTGSMAQSSKMVELKKAAKDLLATMKKASKKLGDVKVAIIPFDTTVKIGTAYKDEFWIDYAQRDIAKDSWQGCVQDRDRNPNNLNNNTKDTAPVLGDDHTYFPAVQCGSLVSLIPLTDVFDETGFTNLNDKVTAMTPAGNTNTTIGMVWGWHALTPNLPLTQGSEPANDLDKVIIMLTDGTNTEDRWDDTAGPIDARMQMTCDNMRGKIRVYTVRVINGNADLLRKCASNPNMFYEVADASQLSSVFTSIAQNLANLRISR